MPDQNPPLLSCENLHVTVPGRLLVEDLNLQARRGELIAVLGQNGAGKSLTLMTMAGLRTADSGGVSLSGANIFTSPRQDTARQLALLPQTTEDIFPASVIETVLIGRHPHIGRLNWESEQDITIARRSLDHLGLADLANRDVQTLSGGERRRVSIAQVVAQAPDVYLLDEPTNHLDPQHQIDALQLFRRAADNGSTVIASLHDANLAVRFADRCLLLYGDGRWQLGDTSEVLTENSLSELFATRMETVSWRSHKLFVAASDYPAP